MANKLSKIAENIWCADHDLYVPGGFHFNTRMTIIRLEDGRLWIHSPIPIEPLKDEIDVLGEVGWLVAPSKLHHLFFPQAVAAFPDAETWAAPGLAQKRDDIEFDNELSGTSPWPEIDWQFIDGAPDMNEVVFLHRPSNTVLCTDLIFNVHEVSNWRSKILFTLVGVWQRPQQSMVWRFATKDRAAAGRSVQATSDWDIDRVVMCHGRILEGPTAKIDYIQAVGWMLSAAPAKQLVAA